jgi:hypothetical protein
LRTELLRGEAREARAVGRAPHQVDVADGRQRAPGAREVAARERDAEPRALAFGAIAASWRLRVRNVERAREALRAAILEERCELPRCRDERGRRRADEDARDGIPRRSGREREYAQDAENEAISDMSTMQTGVHESKFEVDAVMVREE